MEYTDGIEHGSISDHVELLILTGKPDQDDRDLGRLFRAKFYKRMWYLIKKYDYPTQVIYTTALSFYPSENDFKKKLTDLKERGLKVIFALGEDVYRLFGYSESLSKMRGSVLEWDGLLIIPTYDPVELRTKRFKTGNGNADLSLCFNYDLKKAIDFAQGKLSIPKENFNINPTVEDIEKFVYEGMDKGDIFGLDIETTSLSRQYGEVVVVGMARNGSDALCVPFYDGRKRYFRPSEEWKVKLILEDLFTKGKMMWQNALFDVPYLRYNGFKVDLRHITHDTMLLHHSISPELKHDLGFINSLYGTTKYWKDDFLKRDKSILDMDQAAMRTYNLRDCVVLHHVLPGLLEDLDDVGTGDVYYNEALPSIIGAIEQMENGILVDQDQVKIFTKDVKRRLVLVERKLRELGRLPAAFNLNSSDHLGWLVFGEPLKKFETLDHDLHLYDTVKQQAIRCSGCDKKSWWVPAEDDKHDFFCKKCGSKEFYVLEEWKEEPRKKAINNKGERTKVYQDLLDLRDLRNMNRLYDYTLFGSKSHDSNKFRTNKNERERIMGFVGERINDISNFIRPTEQHQKELKDGRRFLLWLRMFNKYCIMKKMYSTYTKFPVWRDGRIHPSILLHGTATGRPAARGPNILNYPKKEKGHRSCLIAPPGGLIVSMDYSNIEAIMLAYITGDPKFIAAVLSGNLHDSNTRALFNLEPDHPLWALARRAAKIFQFGHINKRCVNRVNCWNAKGKKFPKPISSQALWGQREGSTTRTWNPDRAVKSHERAA